MGHTLERLVEEASQRLESGEPIDLEKLCAAHPEHAKELRELLPAVAILFKLGAAPVEKRTNGAAEALPYARLGDFRLIREIGRGGMGVVYEAEQLSMGRRVALKVLPFAALFDDKSLQRFRNEVRAVAALNHPHIVPVYSIGEERGVHFFAMQLIRGQSLAELIHELREACSVRPFAVGQAANCDAAPTVASAANPQSTTHTEQARIRAPATSRRSAETFRSAARLGIQAAEALQHAHDLGVLHRDIKPSNLLLDREGKLYITDFGLARVGSDGGLTMTGDVLGTLRYMAPEQALAKRVVIDHRADIYSLGVTLYELLALEPAFSEPDRAELMKQIAFQEPQPLRKIDRGIPAELETIVAKAMAKQPEERYQTAQLLADDLRAFLDHRPIQAKPPTIVSRAAKWSRRHQTLVSTLGLALVLLTAVLAVSTALVNGARKEAIAALETTSGLLYTADMTAAFQAWEKGWSDEVQEILARQKPAPGAPDRRGLEWHLLDSLVQQPKPLELAGHSGPVNELSVFPDRRRLASVGDDGTLCIWNATDGTLLKRIELSSEPLYSVAVSPDGRYLAAGSHTLYLCDLEQQYAVRKLYRNKDNAESLAFSADGKHLYAGFRYSEVCRLTLDGDVVERIPCTSRVSSLALMPMSGQLLVPSRRAASDGRFSGVIQIWNDDLSLLCEEITDPAMTIDGITVARSSPCEMFIAAGRRYHSDVLLFDLTSQRLIAQTPRFRAPLESLAYSPDGTTIAAGFGNGVVQLLDVYFRGNDASIDDRPRTIKAHLGRVDDVQFIDRDTLATCGGAVVHIWNLARHAVASASTDSHLWIGPEQMAWKRKPRDEQILGIELSPDGSQLLCRSVREILLANTANGDSKRRGAYPGKYGNICWSASGKRIALCSADRNEVEITDQGLDVIFAIAHGESPNAAAFSPTDDLIAVVGDRDLQLCRGDQGTELFRQPLDSPGLAVVFSHDSRQLAYGGRFEGIYILDPNRHRTVRELAGSLDTDCLAFSHDDRLLAAIQGDGAIRIWDSGTGRLMTELVGHEHRLQKIAFSADDRTLISAAVDGTIRLWSVEQGRSYGILYRFSDSSECHVSLSADGRHLAVGYRDHRGGPEVLLWYRNSD